jgi:hypothetical protein
MLKILYAACNNENSKIQLSRFLKAIDGKPYIVKVAAYKRSSPKNQHIDWTLDCLFNIFNPEQITSDNDNFNTYYEQVKYFGPDLIISDMEYYTSHIANVLDITLWQCSSSLINLGLTRAEKHNAELYKKYGHLFSSEYKTQRKVNLIDNSNCNFVYSHFGDLDIPPQLNQNYTWVRPYHIVGKEYIPCMHNLISGTLGNNKKIFCLLGKSVDNVAFTEFSDETYSDFILKDIGNYEEYCCNIRNCNLFLCEGQTSFLADAYYNNKYSIVFVNFNDEECVINSMLSEKLKLSHNVYDTEEDILVHTGTVVESKYNPNIKLLHEHLEEI